jgi:hypothetical protein
VANWLGKGSDMGDSGGTVDPGRAVVGAAGVVVAGTPAGGVSPAEGVGDDGVNPAEGVGDDGVSPAEGVGDGVSPAEGVGDNDVDGAAGVVGAGATPGVVVRKVVVGAETRGRGAAIDAGAPPADERACANAASGSSSKRATAARTGGLGVSIAITMVLPAVPLSS